MAAIGVVFNKMINRSIIHEVGNFSEGNKNITTQIFKENRHISSGEGFDNGVSSKYFIRIKYAICSYHTFVFHFPTKFLIYRSWKRPSSKSWNIWPRFYILVRSTDVYFVLMGLYLCISVIVVRCNNVLMFQVHAISIL